MSHRSLEIRGIESRLNSEAVPLQSAVLCVDCEFVSTSRCDVCPICSGRSLLSLAGMVGGRLLDYKTTPGESEGPQLFDLEITLEMRNVEGQGLSSTIERITSLVAPSLGQGEASCHIRVEPVVQKKSRKTVAA